MAMSDKKRKKKRRITLQDTLKEILQPEQPGYMSPVHTYLSFIYHCQSTRCDKHFKCHL